MYYTITIQDWSSAHPAKDLMTLETTQDENPPAKMRIYWERRTQEAPHALILSVTFSTKQLKRFKHGQYRYAGKWASIINTELAVLANSEL